MTLISPLFTSLFPHAPAINAWIMNSSWICLNDACVLPSTWAFHHQKPLNYCSPLKQSTGCESKIQKLWIFIFALCPEESKNLFTHPVSSIEIGKFYFQSECYTVRFLKCFNFVGLAASKHKPRRQPTPKNLYSCVLLDPMHNCTCASTLESRKMSEGKRNQRF